MQKIVIHRYDGAISVTSGSATALEAAEIIECARSIHQPDADGTIPVLVVHGALEPEPVRASPDDAERLVAMLRAADRRAHAN